MLWESARVPTAFSSSPVLSRGLLTRLKQAEHVFFLISQNRENTATKKGKQLVYFRIIKM